MITLSEIDDTGSYRCIAENVAGETEKTFELDVQGEKAYVEIKQNELEVDKNTYC